MNRLVWSTEKTVDSRRGFFLIYHVDGDGTGTALLFTVNNNELYVTLLFYPDGELPSRC